MLGALLGWSVVGGKGVVLDERKDGFCYDGGSCVLGCRFLECIGGMLDLGGLRKWCGEEFICCLYVC